jgi:PilZ domain
MVRTQQNEERRKARRFEVSWDVAVKGLDWSGRGFDEQGTLENLSSLGAFLYVSRRVNIGETLEVQIKVPFNRNNLMKYSAEVVRLGSANARAGIGIRFQTSVPVFVSR